MLSESFHWDKCSNVLSFTVPVCLPIEFPFVKFYGDQQFPRVKLRKHSTCMVSAAYMYRAVEVHLLFCFFVCVEV